MHPVDVWLEIPDKPPTRHSQRLLERKKFLIKPCDSILSGKIVVYRDLSRKKFRLNGCSASETQKGGHEYGELRWARRYCHWRQSRSRPRDCPSAGSGGSWRGFSRSLSR